MIAIINAIRLAAKQRFPDQSIRAACPAAEGSDADLTAATFLIRHPVAYVTALLPPLRDAGDASLGVQ